MQSKKMFSLLGTVLLFIFFLGGYIYFFCTQKSSISDYVSASTVNTNTAQQSVSLPILMYHSILKNPQNAGKFVVSPATFESDLMYLKENGYESVLISDLIAYTNGKQNLPDKPVLITLDDGYYNNYTYVLPILERLDMKAVISVVGSFTEQFSDHPDPNPNYSYFTWEDIQQAHQSGYIEIQNHSYDMHKQGTRDGSKRKDGETPEQYKKAFTEDALKLQTLLKENAGVTPTAYTYPYGLISPETKEYLKEMGFLCSLTCHEQINQITRDPECLFGLGRYNRPSGISTAAFMEKLLP